MKEIIIVIIIISVQNSCFYFLFFGVHSLAGSNGDEIIDVIHTATTTEIVHRASNTLKNGAYSHCIAQTLDELISDVTNLQTREDEHVGIAGDFAARSLLLTY